MLSSAIQINNGAFLASFTASAKCKECKKVESFIPVHR
jgi:hypothetical protein